MQFLVCRYAKIVHYIHYICIVIYIVKMAIYIEQYGIHAVSNYIHISVSVCTDSSVNTRITMVKTVNYRPI